MSVATTLHRPADVRSSERAKHHRNRSAPPKLRSCTPPMSPDPRSNPFYADPTTVERVHRLGKDFMNRGQHKLGKLGHRTPEDVRFREFYGAPAVVVLDAWNKLVFHALVPEGGWFFHLLWALMFLKLYDREHGLCANAGGSCGAVDRSTLGVSAHWLDPPVGILSFAAAPTQGLMLLRHALRASGGRA